MLFQVCNVQSHVSLLAICSKSEKFTGLFRSKVQNARLAILLATCPVWSSQTTFYAHVTRTQSDRRRAWHGAVACMHGAWVVIRTYHVGLSRPLRGARLPALGMRALRRICSCDHDVSSWSRLLVIFGARAARGSAARAGAKLADYRYPEQPVLAGGLDHRYRPYLAILTVCFNKY